MINNKEIFEEYIMSLERFKKRSPKFLFMLDDCGNYDHQDIAYLYDAWEKSNTNAVPESCVLFPKEPTKELYTAFHEAFSAAGTGRTVDNFRAGYGAMVAVIDGDEGQ